MITGSTKFALIFSAVALVGGCGGNGGQPIPAANVNAVMGTLKSEVFNKFTANNSVSLPANFSGATLNSSRFATKLVSPLVASCETSEPASPVDDDGDGIVNYKKITYNCSDDGSTPGFIVTRKGYYIVEDADNTEMGFFAGLSIKYNMTEFSTENLTTGDKSNYTFLGNWSWENVNDAWVSKGNYEGHVMLDSPSYSFVIDYGFVSTWDFTMTPTNPGTPWAAGTQTYEGTYRMSGTFDNEDANGNHKSGTGTFQISYYSKNLQYDSTCAKWYSKGSTFISDSNGSLFEIRYACATAAFYINGVKSDLFEP